MTLSPSKCGQKLSYRYQLVFTDKSGDIQAAVLAGRAVYRHLYDVLYEQEGIYVWMEESGQSAPSALQGLGKGLAVILGVGCLCGLLYLLSRAYTKKGPGDPTASLFSGLGGSFRSTSTMPSSFDAWSRMRSATAPRAPFRLCLSFASTVMAFIQPCECD